jgi:prepilin-type N-terminal cleavage/methylation domain-containing protein
MISRADERHSGFTLVELLVVITLIMILAGLAAAFLPAIGETARQAQAATMLQQWILTAKQKALRDQVPGGIRLFPFVDQSTGKIDVSQSRTCQFIEQPDDFGVSPTSKTGSLSANAGQPYVTITMPLTNQVSAGDYLEILGCGLMRKITGLSPAASSPNSTQVHLSPRSPMPYNVNPTKQYRIVRAPRVTGDDLLVLPDPVMIDLSTNARFGSSLPTPNGDGSYDILFSPSGAVISPGLTTDSINLWVRDATSAAASTTDGEQTILAIYVRSGLAAAHPPAPGRDPYAFIKDGRTSGK